MSIPDLTKINEEEAIVASSPMVSVFLHGVIKRPVNEYLDIAIQCEWCDMRFALPRAVPEGWLAVGSGAATRYCCSLCAALEFPDE